LREKLTFANVMSSVAVFLALGGTALAVKANSVGSRQIIDDSIKGRDVADGRARVGMGIHPFADETLTEDHPQVELDLDVAAWHEYGAVWEPGSVRFFVDDRQVLALDQAPAYPLQFMLGVYSFVDPATLGPEGFEPTLTVGRFRSLRPRR